MLEMQGSEDKMFFNGIQIWNLILGFSLCIAHLPFAEQNLSARIYRNFPTCKHFSKLTFLSISARAQGGWGSFVMHYGIALTLLRPALSINYVLGHNQFIL
jgi:hypothetical protein